MKRNEKKSPMNQTPEIQKPSQSRDTKPFYTTVWEKTSSILNAAADWTEVFPKAHKAINDTSISASYTARRLENVKGNWNIIVPKSGKKSL